MSDCRACDILACENCEAVEFALGSKTTEYLHFSSLDEFEKDVEEFTRNLVNHPHFCYRTRKVDSIFYAARGSLQKKRKYKPKWKRIETTWDVLQAPAEYPSGENVQLAISLGGE